MRGGPHRQKTRYAGLLHVALAVQNELVNFGLASCRFSSWKLSFGRASSGMPLYGLVPQRSWVGKNFGEIFRPPRPLLRSPLRGGALPGPPDPPGDPPPPGPTPKKGSPLPARKNAKKGEKRGPNMPEMGFLGAKMAIFGRNLHFFDEFSKVSGELCREKNAPRRLLSAGEKPANLYSTKCRFFGPPPPPGGYQCTECTSRGSRGPSPPRTRPSAVPTFAPRAPSTCWMSILLKKLILIIFFININ
jgi:hypothetical protein